MAITGERKRIWMREYMRSYMRRWRGLNKQGLNESVKTHVGGVKTSVKTTNVVLASKLIPREPIIVRDEYDQSY